jgi:hypothetical protein
MFRWGLYTESFIWSALLSHKQTLKVWQRRKGTVFFRAILMCAEALLISGFLADQSLACAA